MGSSSLFGRPGSALLVSALLVSASLASTSIWSGCAEPVPPLAPGECRTDVDCPGDLSCLVEADDVIGRCGCSADAQCPGLQTCDDARGTCGCVLDVQCPAGLACVDGVCACEDDGMCHGPPCATGTECPVDHECLDGRCRLLDSTGLSACACVGGACVRPDRLDAPVGPDQAPLCDVEAYSARNACGGKKATRIRECDAQGRCDTGPQAVGETCGVGGWGRWTCTGCDTPLRCCDPDRIRSDDLQAVCDPRAGHVESERLTGEASVVDSSGGEICCPSSHFLDPCGACIGPDDPLFDELTRPSRINIGDTCSIDASASTGVWRCEEEDGRSRARCAHCPNDDAGRPVRLNLCGGCGELVPSGAPGGLSDEITAEHVRNRAPCGGPEARLGFVSDCPGVLDCADAFTLRCEPTGVKRCDDYCGPVVVPIAEGASRPGLPTDAEGNAYCVLGRPDQTRACQTLSEIDGATRRDAYAEVGDVEPVALSFDDLAVDRPCGVCGEGRWQCDEAAREDIFDGLPRLFCSRDGVDGLNHCGGCAPVLRILAGGRLLDDACLDREPNVANCECIKADGSPGVLSCDSEVEALRCTDGGRNACGGTAPRPGGPDGAELHAPCGPANCRWVYACIGEDLACVEPDRRNPPGRQMRANACNGCSPLDDMRLEQYCEVHGGEMRCTEDRESRVCVLEDDDVAPPGSGDADGLCQCAGLDGRGAVVRLQGVCRFLLDPHADVSLVDTCNDDDPFSTACAADQDCPEWQFCVNATCAPCGSPEIPCCPGLRCESGAECDALADEQRPAEPPLCRPCGSEGDPCCIDGDGNRTICCPPDGPCPTGSLACREERCVPREPEEPADGGPEEPLADSGPDEPPADAGLDLAPADDGPEGPQAPE